LQVDRFEDSWQPVTPLERLWFTKWTIASSCRHSMTVL
jgi:hypothetical protein